MSIKRIDHASGVEIKSAVVLPSEVNTRVKWWSKRGWVMVKQEDFGHQHLTFVQASDVKAYLAASKNRISIKIEEV